METQIRYNFTSDKDLTMDEVLQVCVERFKKEKKKPFIGEYQCMVVGMNGSAEYQYSVSLILIDDLTK